MAIETVVAIVLVVAIVGVTSFEVMSSGRAFIVSNRMLTRSSKIQSSRRGVSPRSSSSRPVVGVENATNSKRKKGGSATTATATSSTTTSGTTKRSKHPTAKSSSPPLSSNNELADSIINEMKRRADPHTQAWFTNYVKGSTWIGCKTPIVKQIMKEIMVSTNKNGKNDNNDVANGVVYNDAIVLLKHPASDVKLAGMILLSEYMPVTDLANFDMIDKLENELFLKDATILDDWSTIDWFSIRVLQKIIYNSNDTKVQQNQQESSHSGSNNDGNNDKSHIAYRVLNFTNNATTSLWHRRCGVVPFVQYTNPKNRMKLPIDFPVDLIDACERSLLISPTERFTQTAIAWVLRYTLANSHETNYQKYAFDMIVRHGPLWTKEAKKSFTEKLKPNDPIRTAILSLK